MNLNLNLNLNLNFNFFIFLNFNFNNYVLSFAIVIFGMRWLWTGQDQQLLIRDLQEELKEHKCDLEETRALLRLADAKPTVRVYG